MELRLSTQSFTNTYTHSLSAQDYSGDPIYSTFTIIGLTPNLTYHWQARVKGDGGYSLWQYFPEGAVDTDFDFGIDQINPEISDNQSGYDVWQKSAGKKYDVDFFDSLSGLNYAQYTIYSGEGKTGEQLKPWTDIFTNLNQKSYTTDWEFDFSSCVSGINYVSVRVCDNVGNFATLDDVFYVKKDTIPPLITVNTTGDDTWRNQDPGAIYDVDFSDNLSYLDTAQYCVYSATGMQGNLIKDWTDIFTSTNVPSYTENFSIDFSTLQAGYNYISIRCWDIAGSTSIVIDAFYIKKDTIPPEVPQLITPADSLPLNDSTPFFDWSSSSDLHSGISNYEIEIDDDINFSLPEYSNTPLFSEDSSSSLSDGKYYWRVRVKDIAGNYSSWSSTRSFLIDTSPPDYFTNFESKRYEGTWISETEWNNWWQPDVRINCKDIESGLRVRGSRPEIDWQLRAYWKFDEGEGQVAGDSSGNSNDGQLGSTTDTDANDPSWTLGYSGNALLFDGNDDYVYVQNYASLNPSNKNWKVEAMIKTSYDGVILARGDSNYGYSIYVEEGKAKGAIRVSGNLYVVDSNTTINDDSWHKVALMIKKNQIEIYVDDTLKGVTETSDYIANEPADEMEIGADRDSAVGNITTYFTGKIDEVKLYTFNPALWHLDEGDGDTVYDSAGTNNGTIYGATWDDGISGKCLYFDGSSYVEVGKEGDPSLKDWTVECYFKTSSDGVILARGDSNDGYSIYVYDGILKGAIRVNGSREIVTSSVTVTDNKWHYAALVIKSNEIQIYLDGELKNTYPTTGYIASDPGETMQFGYDNSSDVGETGAYFTGYIDEVRVLNRALTSSEIKDNFLTAQYRYSTDGGNNWSSWQKADITGSNYTVNYETISVQVPFNQDSETQNKIQFKIYDMAGNSNTSPVYTVKIDTLSPITPSLISPDDNAYFNTGSIDFDWTDSSDTVSGVRDYTIEVSTAIDFSTLYYSSTTLNSQLSTNLDVGRYWWRVRARDFAGNYSKYSSTRSFCIDLSSPVITNNQTGDTTWRIKNNGFYDVDFSDDLELSYFEVKASTGGDDLISWTVVISNINSSSYTDNWQLPDTVFNSLLSGPTNYISIRVFDRAGNYAVLENAFFVLKDTVPPVITDLQDGDTIWRRINDGVYNIDYSDFESKLDYVQYKIVSGTGGVIIDWYTYASGINFSSYTDDFSLLSTHFSQLNSSYSYVSVRVFDVAGNTATLNNAFYIKKDTIAPTVYDFQDGDDIWRDDPGTTYNVDFEDNLSKIDYIQYRIFASTGGKDPLITDWYNLVNPGYNQKSYTENWQVSFADCQNGYNYIGVRVFDIAGNSTTVYDVFYVKKDQVYPDIYDNQLGDDTWRRKGGTKYDVDFEDLEYSLLKEAQYKVTTGLGQTGDIVIDWTYIFSSTAIPSYTDNWQVLFSSLTEGYNYVSVRCIDNAGNLSSLDDVFYILKDTTPPVIIDNQEGDDTWRRTNDGIYNIDYSDSGGSKIDYVQYKIVSGTGGVIIDWYTYASNINSDSYTDDFSLLSTHFSQLNSSYNYVSVRCVDVAGSTTTLENAFYIKKDTIPPVITDNQEGDDTWRISDPGAIYDVDFEDSLSLLDYAQYIVYSGPNKTGNLLKNWTSIFVSTNVRSY
ncbi:MAG: hypothetical protein DRI36_04680, partial [Caldiserica bacterium]